MLLGSIFERFVNGSPVTVMVRGLLDHALTPAALDALFKQTAQRQYQRELLFSSVVELMTSVVCKFHGSVHAAYQANPGKLNVSVDALYDKLDRMEPAVASALVTQVGAKLTPVIRQLRGGGSPLLPGYRVRMLDGNHLAATERRLKALRDLRGGPLPGQALCVFDPERSLVTQVCCCEDGHAQERAVLPEVLPLVRPRDVWVADRNFCTTGFLFGLAQRQAFFVIRQHAQTLHWKKLGRQRYRGRCDTGKVFEQQVALRDAGGNRRIVRQITLELDKPTRDGERVLHILTNLPAEDANALTIVQLYRARWKIETAFQEIERDLASEIETLAYPKAALFGFCVALVASNILSVLKAALRAVHGPETIATGLSSYYLADEIQRTYGGMLIAIPAEHWRVFENRSVAEMAVVLKDLAGRVDLRKLRKHPRGPKKPSTKKPLDKRRKHVATARILAARKEGTN